MIYAENILLCIAVPFLTVLYFVRGSVRRFVVAFLLGMAVCLVSAYLGSYLGMLAGMGDETKVYLSPVVEELMKFFPLLLYIPLPAAQICLSETAKILLTEVTLQDGHIRTGRLCIRILEWMTSWPMTRCVHRHRNITMTRSGMMTIIRTGPSSRRRQPKVLSGSYKITSATGRSRAHGSM